MNKQDSRTKLLVVMVIATLVLIPGRFSYQSMQDLKDEASVLRDQAASVNERVLEAEEASSSESFEDDLKAYQAALPPDANLKGLIDEVSAVARSSGVRWVAGTPVPVAAAAVVNPVAVDPAAPVDPNAPAPAFFGDSYTLSMAVEGKPDDVSKFLDGLRSLTRLVVVDSVNLQSGEFPGTVRTALETRFFSSPGGF